MENYICIKGKNIALTDEQIKEIEKSFNLKGLKLKDIPIGETFMINKYEFIVLEQSGDTTAVILKNLLYKSKEFGCDNNYEGSKADELCCKIGNEIEKAIGEGNLVIHTVDLTSNDGLTDYKMTKRKMSLLTAEQYRRYVYTIDKYKLDSWWWLATAWSTPTHGSSNGVLGVSPVGSIGGSDCANLSGFRPFCILKSNIFVSK